MREKLSKETQGKLEDYKKLSHALQKVKREHEELEYLLWWVQGQCEKDKMQFCGIKTIFLDTGLKKYVAFFLQSQPVMQTRRIYPYTLFGYMGNGTSEPVFAYKAQFAHEFSEIPVGIESKIIINDHHVQEEWLKRRGIGTSAMDMIKDLARQMHCTRISGRRVPGKDTPEAHQNLWDFYKKNGFHQSHDNVFISYDMTQYKGDDDQTNFCDQQPDSVWLPLSEEEKIACAVGWCKDFRCTMEDAAIKIAEKHHIPLMQAYEIVKDFW